MEWTFVWLMLVLKIPVVAAIWLVWWAMNAEPEPAAEDDGGTKVPDPGSPHHPKPPHHPRRGPHGDGALPSPPRVRKTTVVREHSHDG